MMASVSKPVVLLLSGRSLTCCKVIRSQDSQELQRWRRNNENWPRPQNQIQLRLFSSTTANSLCHYEVLDIPRTATQREIKQAYLKKTREFHPDKHRSDLQSQSGPNDQKDHDRNHAEAHNTFVEINQAYEVLGKASSRHIYDLSLSHPDSNNPGEPKAGMYRDPETGIEVEDRFYSFDERARGYGYRVNHYFIYDPRESYKIAAGCVAFIIFGFIVHYNIAKMTFAKHMTTMNKFSQKLSEEEAESNRVRMEGGKSKFQKSLENRETEEKTSPELEEWIAGIKARQRAVLQKHDALKNGTQS